MSDQPNATAATEDFEFAALQKAVNYRKALLREFAPHLRGGVIEVGAGIGQFTGSIAALPGVTETIAVEPDAGFCRAFRQNHPGRHLIEGTAEDLPPGTEGDAIVSINVLEHIRDDEAELARYARLLSRRRGCLCLFVPARPEIYADIDRDFGHFRRYVRSDLRTKLRTAGLEVVRLHYFNWIGYFGWWFNFRVLRKRGFDPRSVEVFDRYIFPAGHLAERYLARPPLGQSLLAVARKSGVINSG